jgi:RNA-dependent RNA polymerase
MRLAAMCSQAVDYAKNGNPVDIHNNNLPKPLIKFKPDWHKAEVTGARELDYYVSDRALGDLFRKIELHDPNEPIEDLPTDRPEPLQDPISRALAPIIEHRLNTDGVKSPGIDEGDTEGLHARYIGEMRYICFTHTLIDTPDVRLTEEEVVLGTILANCTQSRWRSDRSYRMKLQAESLVGDVRTQIVQNEGPPTEDQLRAGLSRAWAAWGWAQHHRDREYIESFALLMLGIIFDCLKRLDGIAGACALAGFIQRCGPQGL